MKKLLSILGAITLIGTSTTSIVACDGGETPTSDTKIDISNKITSPLDLGQLSADTASEFLVKLQAKLVTISGLSNIKTTDYDVYKAGTTTAIQDSDILTLKEIKMVAKGNNFTGNKDNIVVRYTT